jgi:hypothetical protein
MNHAPFPVALTDQKVHIPLQLLRIFGEKVVLRHPPAEWQERNPQHIAGRNYFVKGNGY